MWPAWLALAVIVVYCLMWLVVLWVPSARRPLTRLLRFWIWRRPDAPGPQD